MKCAIALGVHDRIDDLDVHLDILDFSPIKFEKIIAWSDPKTPQDRIEEWKSRASITRVPTTNFCIGPLFALTYSLRMAHKLKCDYMIYRNADDWLFNHESVIGRVFSMANKFLFAGYNWLSHATYQDYALNEITFHVPTFAPWIKSMEHSFINSSQEMLCEFKIARWVNRLVPLDKMLRLSDRERYPGIGNNIDALEYLEAKKHIELPQDWKNRWKDNQRFFHRGWQMIGSHEQEERLKFYNIIKSEISYSRELETKKDFRRWLFAAKNKLPWNLQGTSTHKNGRKIPSSLSKRPEFFPSFFLCTNNFFNN